MIRSCDVSLSYLLEHKLKNVLRENPPPNGHRVTLQWKEVVTPAIARQRHLRACTGTNQQGTADGVCYTCPAGTIRPPKGYVGEDYPRLVANSTDVSPEGVEPCPHCLCTPCIIAQPPSFLTGSAAPAIGNMSKRFSLYRKFWQLLKEIGVWRCETYLQRKSTHTSRDDPREIIPKCVVAVS